MRDQYNQCSDRRTGTQLKRQKQLIVSKVDKGMTVAGLWRKEGAGWGLDQGENTWLCARVCARAEAMYAKGPIYKATTGIVLIPCTVLDPLPSYSVNRISSE